MRRLRSAAVILIALVATASRGNDLSIRVFIDAYDAWNDNHPRSHENFFSGTGTTAKRADEIDLNLAAIEIACPAKPVGFQLSLVDGRGADVVHSGEPKRHFRHLYQASLSYNAPVGRGLLFEGGVYPSHIGFEGFFSPDNWNYTRSWLGEFTPYYQSGIKVSYAWNDRWSARIDVLRGWQLISDNNSASSLGAQLAYASGRLSASFNTFIGPELANDDKHLRTFGDLVLTWKMTPKATFAASLDRGHQAFPNDVAANWLGIAGYARYAVDDRRAVAVRAERFRDPNNGISGTAQTLTETTITVEIREAKHLIFKIEGRHDHSSAPVFDHTHNQTLLIAAIVVTFRNS